jgi:hypothetical protein
MNLSMLFLLSDPRNPPRHLKHRINQDHKEDREEQHQWQKCIKNLCAISIECVGESLYETNSRGNTREILNIYAESPLEVENDGDFHEQGSYFIKTLSSPCSYKKLQIHLVSLTLPHTRSSTPLCSLFLKIFKGWLKTHMFIINIADLVVLNLEISTHKLVLEEKPLCQFIS